MVLEITGTSDRMKAQDTSLLNGMRFVRVDAL
jgi:hypothetical protein